jgi:hypothetical protein
LTKRVTIFIIGRLRKHRFTSYGVELELIYHYEGREIDCGYFSADYRGEYLDLTERK